MNTVKFSVGRLSLESAKINGVQFVRDPEGVWRFAETGIPVPGARDVTLTERFDPKLIVRSDGEVERVVVSGASIEVGGDLLDWCLEEGSLVLDGDRLIEVLVPYPEWQKRDRIPGELIVPELHGTEPERELAEAERQFREAERGMEEAAAGRAEVLRRYADEMTRQEARAITGLSVGRIQQLIRSELLEEHERTILETFQAGPFETFGEFAEKAEEAGLPTDTDLLQDAIEELQNRGYIEWIEGTGEVLTQEGADVLLSAQTADRRSGAQED